MGNGIIFDALVQGMQIGGLARGDGEHDVRVTGVADEPAPRGLDTVIGPDFPGERPRPHRSRPRAATLTTDLGVVRIAARIVATLARDAARTVPGVRVALGRSTHGNVAALAERATCQHHHPYAAVGVLGRTAVVDLAVAVSYGEPVHEVARHIQRQVIATLRDEIGLQTVAVNVNVTVDDVLIGEDQ